VDMSGDFKNHTNLESETREKQFPGAEEAEQILLEASRRNPGPWVDHSRVTAQAAREVAAHLPGLDTDRAYIFGLLHDIGREAGVYDMRHIMDGYRLMSARGYPAVARICLTHSFPLKDVRTMADN